MNKIVNRAETFQASESYKVAVLLTLTGGFLDAYTYISRDGVFANAQTGNFARLGISLANRDFYAALRYVIPIIAFLLGITFVMQARIWLQRFPYLHWRQVLLLVEIAIVVVVSQIPSGSGSNICANVLVSFVCAIQVETFRKFYGNTFASTMCTGNLRAATESLNHFFNSKEQKILKKSLYYFGIDCLFVVGIVLGVFSTKQWGSLTILLCCISMIAAFFCMFKSYP